jgi:hypothetical protein
LQKSVNRQIHSALAYYYDHKQKFDEEMAELSWLAEELRARQGESLLAKKLREMGRELPCCRPQSAAKTPP